jgi:hypothetical protein
MENKEKIELLEQLIDGAEASIKAARQIVAEISGNSKGNRLGQMARALNVSSGGKVIEGVFDGEHMIGPDQKKFPVPANYASKSKLIQGDVLKLTINSDGSFMFKQIKPANRKKIVGTLTYADGDYRVLAEGKAYKVLFASITFHKVQPGDSVVIVVPENNTGQWAAIENIVHPEAKKDQQEEQSLEDIQSGEPLRIGDEEEGIEMETADISDILGDMPSQDQSEDLEVQNYDNQDSGNFSQSNQFDQEESFFEPSAVNMQENAPLVSPPLQGVNQQGGNTNPAPNQAFDQEIKELEI